MKIPFALSLTIAACSAQNVLVNFYPANQPFAGLTNYPAQDLEVTWSTNSPGWATNMLDTDYAAYKAGLLPAYLTASSNAQYQASLPVATNLANYMLLSSMIPLGLADCTTRTNTLWTEYWSFRSGTNSAAGTNAIVADVIMQCYISDIYHREILDLLSRLGPVLQQLYQPASDPVVGP